MVTKALNIRCCFRSPYLSFSLSLSLSLVKLIIKQGQTVHKTVTGRQRVFLKWPHFQSRSQNMTIWPLIIKKICPAGRCIYIIHTHYAYKFFIMFILIHFMFYKFSNDQNARPNNGTYSYNYKKLRHYVSRCWHGAAIIR